MYSMLTIPYNIRSYETRVLTYWGWDKMAAILQTTITNAISLIKNLNLGTVLVSEDKGWFWIWHGMK